MDKDEKYELLNYKIKTLQLILSTVIGENCIFYNFVIDHDLSQQKVSIIFRSLSILFEISMLQPKYSYNYTTFTINSI